MSRGISIRETSLGWRVLRLHYSAAKGKDPSTPEGQKWLEEARAGMSDARFRKEFEIEYSALQGDRWFPEFSREFNVCEPHDVSDRNEWTIYHGCDPHQRVAHAHVWVAFSSHGDVRVCGELWPQDVDPEKRQIAKYVEAIAAIESKATDKEAWGNGCFEWANGKELTIYKRIMDTFGHAVDAKEGQDYFAAYRQHSDIFFHGANKSDLGATREAVAEALAPKPMIVGERNVSAASMKIFSGCTETIKEFETVRYPGGDVERPSQERPATFAKHLLDGLLYIYADRAGFVLPRTGPRRSGWEPISPAVGW